MKKLSISLLIALGLLTVGCNDKEKQQVKELQNEITKLEQQLEEQEKEVEKIETPEPTDAIPAESKPADKNKKAKAVELAQCYDCGEEKDVSKMKYEGISDRYHCGCNPEYKNIKNDNPKDFMETCLICKEKMHCKYGKIAEDGWACYTCIDKVNNGLITECMGCAKFYDANKIKYDVNTNPYCHSCYDKYAEKETCDNCGSTNEIGEYRLTLADDGMNMNIKLCTKCWNDQLEYRKQHSFCWQCGWEVPKDEACPNCFPMTDGICGYCNEFTRVFYNLDGWNVPVCEPCMRGMH